MTTGPAVGHGSALPGRQRQRRWCSLSFADVHCCSLFGVGGPGRTALTPGRRHVVRKHVIH
jgi:hypothetical protein